MSPMSKDPLRNHLAKLLDAQLAHVSANEVLQSFDYSLLGRKPAGAPYTPWELFEHLRIAQWDILEFSRDADHVSPEFPNGYWPDQSAPASRQEWGDKRTRFFDELQQMKELIERDSSELFEKIPHGSGQTLAREAMVLADHNAYHLGQIVLLRKILERSSS